MWLTDDEAEEIFTAIGIGSAVNQKAPALLRRRKGRRGARFVTVYDLSGSGDYVTGVKLTDGEFPAMTIATTDRKWMVAFTTHGISVGK